MQSTRPSPQTTTAIHLTKLARKSNFPTCTTNKNGCNSFTFPKANKLPCSAKQNKKQKTIPLPIQATSDKQTPPANLFSRRNCTTNLSLSALSAVLSFGSDCKPSGSEELTDNCLKQDSEVLVVGSQGGAFSSISEALKVAQPGATVRVQPGTYNERLVLEKSVTIEALEPGSVVVEHSTDRPYEATVETVAERARVVGLTLLHRSPSIANNYCVYAWGGRVELEGCDVASSTGCGVGVEGAAYALTACRIANAKNHGIALYGDLLGGGGVGTVTACVIEDNGGCGVLVRDGAYPTVTNCTIRNNRLQGVLVSDARIAFNESLNVLSGNKKGGLELENGAEID